MIPVYCFSSTAYNDSLEMLKKSPKSSETNYFFFVLSCSSRKIILTLDLFIYDFSSNIIRPFSYIPVYVTMVSQFLNNKRIIAE